MIKISSRLKEIADFIDDDSKIIDIGCDHGLLDIYMVQNKKNIEIIASDVNENALNNAKRNIKKYKLEDKINVVLSDGLSKIDIKPDSTIVIAGMGSHTIAGILYNNLKKIKNANQLILQSNNDLDFLRYKVTKIGYYIEKEKLVKDAGIIYTIIKFKKGYRFYSKKELFLGPYLLKEKNDLFNEKNKNELYKLEKIYPMIPKNHYHHRRKINKKIKMLKKILK